MSCLSLHELTPSDREQITSAWARKIARARRIRWMLTAIKVALMTVGLAGACLLVWARAQGWLP